MKKTVKILIAASSVAAVVGLGTVSFAMWSGGSSSVVVEGTMGVVDVIGDISVEAKNGGSGSSANNNIKMDSLLPIDNAHITSSGVIYWQFEVKLLGGTSNATVSVTGGFEDSVQADLYFTEAEPSFSSYSGTDVTAEPTFTLDKDYNYTHTVYFYMTAYGANAMNADVKLTFTASVVTP